MLGICLAYVWHMLEICLACVWHMLGICLAYAWNTLGICLEYAWHMLGICLKYAWHMLGTCLAYAWHMLGICLKYAWNMLGVCLSYAWHMLGICLAYTSHSIRTQSDTALVHKKAKKVDKAPNERLTWTIMSGICLEYAWNLVGICLAYACNMLATSNFHRTPVFGPRVLHEITTRKKTTVANHEGNTEKLNANMPKNENEFRHNLQAQADTPKGPRCWS